MNSMDKLGDIDLFIKIVKNNGLAAAGRETGLSAASVTAKLNKLEEHYGVRLLNRTTRRIGLTEEGKEFYDSCLRILEDIAQAEERLITGREALSGRLKVTATHDLGQKKIAPLLAHFVEQHPMVSVLLHLTDGVVNLVESEFDLGVRYGGLQDSRMIARKLASNYRVLCAAPKYFDTNGKPKTPEDLKEHSCLAIVRKGEVLTNWHFTKDRSRQVVTVQPTLSSNDSSQIRRWALAGNGIALKSYWDIKDDLESNRLIRVLEQYDSNYSAEESYHSSDLHVVYPSRDFLPERTRVFIDFLMQEFAKA